MQHCLRPVVHPQPQKYAPDLLEGALLFEGKNEYYDRYLIEAVL